MRCARFSLVGLAVLVLTCGSAAAEGWNVRNLWPFGKKQPQQTGPLLDAPSSVEGFGQTKSKKLGWPKVSMPSLWPKKKADRGYISKKHLGQKPSTAERLKGGAQSVWDNTAGRLMPSKQKQRAQPIPTDKSTHSNWLPASWFKPIKSDKKPETPAEWIGKKPLEF